MQSLGVKVVAAAGTPVQATTNANIFCDEIIFQPLQTYSAAATAPVDNAGAVYIMNSNAAKAADSTNILLVLLPGQPGTSLRSRSDKGLNLSHIWIDADNTSDGVHISWI